MRAWVHGKFFLFQFAMGGCNNDNPRDPYFFIFNKDAYASLKGTRIERVRVIDVCAPLSYPHQFSNMEVRKI